MGGNDMEENCSTRKEFVRKTQKSGQTVHCKKRLSFFPPPAGMSFTKLSLAGNY
jgi:hypothetical protein